MGWQGRVGVWGRGVTVLLAFTLALLVSAAPASAHAVLQEVTPTDGATLEASPEQVTLAFNEAISTTPAGIRVFNAEGERVDSGDARMLGDPATAGVDLQPDLVDGTYVVTWRVTSSDNHPLKGAWLFTIGDVVADESLLAALFEADGDRGTAIAAVVVRWLMYGATLVAGGAAIAYGRLSTHLAPRRTVLLHAVRVAALVGIGATVAGLAVQIMLVTGLGVRSLSSGAAAVQVLGSGYGLSAGVRLAALLGILLWIKRSYGNTVNTRLGVGGGILAVASFAAEGHTLTSSPMWLVVSADVVHVLAAAVWVGGLLALAIAIGRAGISNTPVRTAQLVAAFSVVATWSVLGVAIAGITLGWIEVQALRALTSTTYGWTLVVKLLLLIPVAIAAMYNNRRLVPAVAGLTPGRAASRRPIPAGGATDIDIDDSPTAVGAPGQAAIGRLRRSLSIELGGIGAVLAATALLVGLQPAAEAAGIAGAYSTYVPLGEDYEINLTVDPNRVGVNQIHVYVLRNDGRQAEIDDDLVLGLRQPARDVGPLRRQTTRLGPGHFLLTGPELSVPGTWEIDLEVPVSRFDVLDATIPVTVNPG